MPNPADHGSNEPGAFAARVLAVLDGWASLHAPPRLTVAFSGGLDSTVLLSTLCRVRAPARIRAVHVDHGLRSVHVDALEVGGISPEAGFPRGVDDRIATFGGGAKRTDVVYFTAVDARAAGLQVFSCAALEGDHFLALAQQLAADGRAEKTAAAGDKDAHDGLMRRAPFAGAGWVGLGLRSRYAGQRNRHAFLLSSG